MSSINESQVVPKPKRERKALSMSVKMEVIKRVEAGERKKEICTSMKLPKSTVHTIWQSRDKIKKTAQTVVGASKLTRLSRTRHPLIERLEKLLILWIQAQSHDEVPFGYLAIQQKAISLFQDLKKQAQEEGETGVSDLDFKASQGWFERFKKRVCMQNRKLAEEPPPATDEVDTSVLHSQLQKIINESGYSTKQIFTLSETGLFWKRLPSRTFISQEEKKNAGYRPSKDKFTLMFGGNLEGDAKLKPLLVYCAESPADLRGLMKSTLPVLWRSNRKLRVTRDLFIDYINTYFSPFVANYATENGLANQALLIVENTPEHPASISEYSDNVRIVFLPPNSTLQPMDQGVITTFRACYLRLLFQYLAYRQDCDNRKVIKDAWKEYNLRMAIKNVAKAWDAIPPESLRAAWFKLLPQYVSEPHEIDVEVKRVRGEIQNLAMRAGFDGVTVKNIADALSAHNEELAKEDVVELEIYRMSEDDEDAAPASLNIKTLTDIFSATDALTSLLEQSDPNFERSLKVKNAIDEAIFCYRELYENKIKEANQNSFLSLCQPNFLEETNQVYVSMPSTSDTRPSSSNSESPQHTIKIEVDSGDEIEYVEMEEEDDSNSTATFYIVP